MKNINDKLKLEDENLSLEVPSDFPEEYPPLIEEDDEEGDDSYNPSRGSNYSRNLFDKYGKW